MGGLGNLQHRHTKITNTTRRNKTTEMPFQPNFHRIVTSNLTFADRVRETQIELSEPAVTKAICNALKQYWEHSIESWEVWGYDKDGCSEEYGESYWVHCDAWSGRSWEYDNARHKGLPKEKKILMEKGIELEGKVYYLEPEMEKLDWGTLRLEQVKWKKTY